MRVVLLVFVLRMALAAASDNSVEEGIKEDIPGYPQEGEEDEINHEHTDMLEEFKELDTDNSGGISKLELEARAHPCACVYTYACVSTRMQMYFKNTLDSTVPPELMAEEDTNGDGFISLEASLCILALRSDC